LTGFVCQFGHPPEELARQYEEEPNLDERSSLRSIKMRTPMIFRRDYVKRVSLMVGCHFYYTRWLAAWFTFGRRQQQAQAFTITRKPGLPGQEASGKLPVQVGVRRKEFSIFFPSRTWPGTAILRCSLAAPADDPASTPGNSFQMVPAR